MQTLLVLTDFSEPALHASKYACQLAQQYNFNRIILYHNYEVIVPGTDIPVTEDDDSLHRQKMEQLAELQESLSGLINDSINIETMAEAGFLGENINIVSQKEMTDIIVMGMKGKSNAEKILMGSNTIKVVDKSDFPVLIIPYHAPILPIHTVLFACDLKQVSETIPADLLSRVLDTF